MHSALARLLQSFFQYRRGQELGLDVHLEGVDTFGCSGDFKVHVAQEVFQSLNVAQDGILAVGSGNQTHCDTGHWGFDWNDGVNQAEGDDTNATH
jgi:hypothetical protein